MAAGVAVVIGAGTIAAVSLTSGPAPARSGRTVIPAGPTDPTAPTDLPLRTLTIEANDFQFQRHNFVVPAGVTEITLVSNEGSHTLVFAAPEFASVHLAAPGGQTTAKVDLAEGHVYTIFCEIAGHRKSGMEATITVSPPS